jgi:hypothetical protein
VLDKVCEDRAEINSVKSKISELKNMNLENKIRFNDDSFRFFMFIPFVAVLTFGISMVIFSASKRREILSYGIQSVMPVAQEGIEKMAPTVGKAGKTVAKEMAPMYGEIAKEISKGIKEGLKDEEK